MTLEPDPMMVLELAETGRGAGEAPENGDGVGGGVGDAVGGVGDGETDEKDGSTPCGVFPKMVTFPPEKVLSICARRDQVPVGVKSGPPEAAPTGSTASVAARGPRTAAYFSRPEARILTDASRSAALST